MATSHQGDSGLDPTAAQTPEAFMQLLRQAAATSGLSTAEIAQRARQRGYDLDPATLTGVLESPTLPSWQTVTGVLTACGLGGMQIDRWIRVYHDLANPAEPIAPAAAPVTTVDEPDDVAPVSVPPLVLTTASKKPALLTRWNLAIGAGVLAALIAAPLLLFTLFDGDPDTVAAEATSAAPRTSDATLPMPLPSNLPVAEPSPTEVAAPTSPAPGTTTTRPPTRTTSPPPPPPPSPQPSPADPSVLRSGSVGLTRDHPGFDLDSGQNEGEGDIYRSNGTTLTGMNGGELEDMSGAPSKQNCQAIQDWAWEFRVGGLDAGEWLCVRTSDNRYARLNITQVGDTLKLSYTVWN